MRGSAKTTTSSFIRHIDNENVNSGVKIMEAGKGKM